MEGDLLIARRHERALGTLPPQPPRRSGLLAPRLGAGVLGAVLVGLGTLAVRRLREKPKAPPPDRTRAHLRAARRLNGAAAILSTSVLADSALQHYRGTFHNPAMYAAPTVAAVSLANSLRMTAAPEQAGAAGIGFCGVAVATGTIGTGFHIYNLAKREGGFDLLNLFYGAPLGAPMAISLAGLAGLAAAGIAAQNDGNTPTLLGLPAGPLLALGASAGLLGTVAEVALRHFRGAFHDPFMYVPVTVPPATAVILAAAVARRELAKLARVMLRVTAAVGLAGVGFHLYGVRRNMGGFGNWRQNILQGPPVPAPPSFTGLAFVGLAALSLMESR